VLRKGQTERCGTDPAAGGPRDRCARCAARECLQDRKGHLQRRWSRAITADALQVAAADLAGRAAAPTEAAVAVADPVAARGHVRRPGARAPIP
jgi:hypothetical protein